MGFRLALVTGATSGIGMETCRMLAQKGIPLIISGRNSIELGNLEKTLSRLVDVRSIQADLSQPEGRQILIKMMHGQVPDLVINNAGFGLYGEALTHETKDQAEILEVNGKAVLEITLEAARAMVSEKRKGVILNVSSNAAFFIMPNMAVYAASKAFVNQFSQALDFEMKPNGIRVLTICPGMVFTQFQERAGGKIGDEQALVMKPAFIAEQIWNQIENLDPLLIVDWKYRLLTFLSSFLPKSWIAKSLGQAIAERIKQRTIIEITK